jgi:hypothetical protein
MINDEGFQNALYMIDMGQNDIADSFLKNLTYAEVVKRIPSIITEIKNAVKVSLYEENFPILLQKLYSLLAMHLP